MSTSTADPIQNFVSAVSPAAMSKCRLKSAAEFRPAFDNVGRDGTGATAQLPAKFELLVTWQEFAQLRSCQGLICFSRHDLNAC
jgi:hypothetical protein